MCGVPVPADLGPGLKLFMQCFLGQEQYTALYRSTHTDLQRLLSCIFYATKLQN